MTSDVVQYLRPPVSVGNFHSDCCHQNDPMVKRTRKRHRWVPNPALGTVRAAMAAITIELIASAQYTKWSANGSP